MPTPSQIQIIEEQLLAGLTMQLEDALDIVASSEASGRLDEIVAKCQSAIALARAGILLLDV